jgi:hypothetical protein
MTLVDFDGTTIVHSEEELLSRLRQRRKGPYGAFILSHDEDGRSLSIVWREL